jgi:acyl-CoA synthetase (AMP-forming)/AMP-acid ligase II
MPEHLPPVDGSITVIPGFVDFHATHNADRTWAIFPSDKNPSGTSTISFGEFARATHRVAHHVRPNRAGPEREVVVVFAHTDAVLYNALLAGMMRAGIIVRNDAYT